jgi:hypothetical protein
MDRKVSHGFESPLYSYAEVERALAAAFGVDAERQRGALRGRLKHLQRLGLPGLEAGKGTRVQYSRAQANQWLLALLMAEIGIDPTIIAKTIKANWKALAPFVEQATDRQARSGNPIYLGLRPRVMSSAWEDRPSLQISMFRRFFTAPRGADSDDLPRKADEDSDNWLCLIDFSRPSNRLDMALPRKT